MTCWVLCDILWFSWMLWAMDDAIWACSFCRWQCWLGSFPSFCHGCMLKCCSSGTTRGFWERKLLNKFQIQITLINYHFRILMMTSLYHTSFSPWFFFFLQLLILVAGLQMAISLSLMAFYLGVKIEANCWREAICRHLRELTNKNQGFSGHSNKK